MPAPLPLLLVVVAERLGRGRHLLLPASASAGAWSVRRGSGPLAHWWASRRRAVPVTGCAARAACRHQARPDGLAAGSSRLITRLLPNAAFCGAPEPLPGAR